MLQEALKTGRAFGGGWRKQENKLSLCLGIVGKQQLSYSKVNILVFLHIKNTPPLLAAVLGPLAVLHDSLQNCEIESFMAMLIYYVTVSQMIKLREWEISVWFRLFICLTSVKLTYTCQIFQNI